MARLPEQADRLLHFDLLSGILHHHPLGGFCHHAHIMGDQHQTHAVVALDRHQKIQNLRLNGHIQCRGRLVGNQQFGLGGQSHRNHHALAHAARQLVRKSTQAPLGIGDADRFQQFDGAAAAGGTVQTQMGFQTFANLEPHGEAGVQAGHRLLEDHRNIAAHGAATLAVRQGQQIQPLEPHDIGGNGRGPWQQAHHGQHRHRFARTRFSDNRHHLVAVNRQIDPVNRQKRTRTGVERHRQIADFQQAFLEHAHRLSSSSISDQAHRATRHRTD